MTLRGFVVSGNTAIPVRNLWLLMLYASQLYQRSELLRDRNVEDNPEDLFDLVAEILVTAVENRLQRSLGQRYRQRAATLTRVRGRIDLLATESKGLLAQGRVGCRFDELSVDNLRNQTLRTALVVAASRVVAPTLQHRARRLVGLLTEYGVSSKMVTVRDTSQLVFGRNEQDDVEAVDAARLLLEMKVPAEQAGNTSTRDPERDAALVRRLYEKAIRGFYCTLLTPEWTVSEGETQHNWPITDASSGLTGVVPIMKTDILLQSVDRRIIVETKFANALKPNQYGQDKFDRNHVFQLYAYVQSQHGRDALSTVTEGVLLYPAVGQHLDESATIQGHRYRFLTVDLASSATAIRRTLLSVIAPDNSRHSTAS